LRPACIRWPMTRSCRRGPARTTQRNATGGLVITSILAGCRIAAGTTPGPPPKPALALDQPVRYRVWPRAILDAQCPVDHVLLSPSSIDGSDPLHPAGTCSWTKASPALWLDPTRPQTTP